MLDLVWYTDGETQQIFAMVLLPEGSDPWRSPAVSFPGAFGPLADALMQAFPTRFPKRDTTLDQLLMVHTANRQRGENGVGQAYPLRY